MEESNVLEDAELVRAARAIADDPEFKKGWKLLDVQKMSDSFKTFGTVVVAISSDSYPI